MKRYAQKHTPYELWFGTERDLSALKVCGCRTHMHVLKATQTAWQDHIVLSAVVSYGSRGV